MKDRIDEHDMTKKMLDTMRGNVISESSTSKEISEDEMTRKMINTSLISEGIDERPASEGIDLSGDELEEEKKAFREAISETARFSVFKVYPEAENVVFGGDLEGIKWQFTYNDRNGPFIDVNNLQLTDDIVEMIRKLATYFKVNWRPSWATKLANEYKTNSNNSI